MKPKPVSCMLVLPACLVLAAAACSPSAVATPTAVPPTTSAPMTMATNQDSWILVDLPPDATQLQHGGEIYRLVCSACHAHSGEGLTDAWRATWHPEDQNCWQSKCHAANHPPDGFELPIAPAVVGRQALAPFATAADLRNYIQATMPWQEPNSLTDEEGWAVTAYVIKLNRMNPGPELNAGNAGMFSLHPEIEQPTEMPQPDNAEAANKPAAADTLRNVGGIAVVALAIFLALRVVRHRGSRN